MSCSHAFAGRLPMAMERPHALSARNALGILPDCGASAGTGGLMRTTSMGSWSMSFADTQSGSDADWEGECDLAPPVRRITVAKAMLAEACGSNGADKAVPRCSKFM